MPLSIFQRQAKIPAISQTDIRAYRDLESEFLDTKAKLQQLEERLSKARNTLLALWEHGCRAEKGPLQIAVETYTVKGACRPKWKEEYLDLMKQEGYDAEIVEAGMRDKYPASSTVVTSLVVSEIRKRK